MVSINKPKATENSYCVKCQEYATKSSRNTCSKCDGELFTTKPKEESFEDIVRRNMENKKRMEEERKKANRSVIRSYRLKPR